jgi:hypothetical protein
MQIGQPIRSGCAPAEPYPHGCIDIVPKVRKTNAKMIVVAVRWFAVRVVKALAI